MSRHIRLASIRKLVEGLVDLDADLAELSRAHEAHDSDAFRSDGPLPPRISRGHFNERCARGDVPGAAKIPGRGRGYWSVSRVDWHRSLMARHSPKVLQVVDALPTDAERADALIEAAGFKLTRR